MPSKINTLSEQTINQIAAGEVVESPASAVKELVENAVDAGAARVKIEIAGGGHQLIRVVDDGMGMGKEDALLCLQRHATSKIRCAEDLAQVMTMGFRGEALASIAAVSKLRLVTSEETLASSPATEIEVEGGKIVHVGLSSRSRGTTVEVRSLFYNIPARKKFQKGIAASTAEVNKVVTQQALAHPDIGFDLVVQGQTIFSVTPSDREKIAEKIGLRSGELLGGHFETDTLIIDLLQGPCHLRGVIGSPLVHRHNRSGQYLFINRRPIISPLIFYAIKDAYGTRLPSDRHPIFSLHIEIPADLVDINVHPQKREVRFREEKMLRDSIQSAVQLALQRKEGAVSELIEKQSPFHQAITFSFSEPSFEREFPPFLFREEGKNTEREEALPLSLSSPRIVGLFSTYLLIEGGEWCAITPSEEGLIILDLQAASARISFESLLKSAHAIPVRQGLLIPVVFSASIEEEGLLCSCEEELAKMGFEVRQCGKGKFMVDAVPSCIESEELSDLLREMLGELKEKQAVHLSQDEKLRALAQVASRFARGRKKSFMLQEAEGILKQLMQTSSPYFCPRGSLTMVHVSRHEIEKKFHSTKG